MSRIKVKRKVITDLSEVALSTTFVVSFKDGQFFVSTTVENGNQRIDVKVVSFQGVNTGTWFGTIFNRPVQRKDDLPTWSGMCISAMRLDNTEKYGLKLEHRGGLKMTGTEIISPIIKKILFEEVLEKVEDHGPSVHLQQMMMDLSLHMMGPIASQERNTAALKLQTEKLESEMKRIKELNDTKRMDWLQKTSVLMCEKTREINRLNSIIKSVQGDQEDDGHGSDVERNNDDDDGDDDDDNSDDNRQKHMPLPTRKQPPMDHHPPKVTIAVSSKGHPKGTASKTSSSSSSSGISRSTSITAGPLESSRSTAVGATTDGSAFWTYLPVLNRWILLTH